MVKERIVVLKLNEERDEYTLTKQIPKDMRSDIFKRIGSEFDRSQGSMSTEIIRGLDNELEKIYLPTLVGEKVESADFPRKARDFWADYTITPTSKGLRLNIATEKKESGRYLEDGTTPIMIDVPVNIDDYMKYMFAKQSSKVASRPEDLDNKGFFDFTLEDLGQIEDKEKSDFELEEKATILYARLVSKFEDNIDKINWILELTKEEGDFFDSDTPTLDKKMMLSKVVKKRPIKFTSLIEDKDLEDNAFLNKLLTYLVITKEGNDYFYQQENMGSESKGALSWIRKPEKSGQVAAMKARLEEAIKIHKQQK